MYSKQKYCDFLKEQKIISYSEAPFTLKSGKQSNWYVNFRSVAQSQKTLSTLAHFVTAYMEQENFEYNDGVLGVPEGSTMLAQDVQKMLIENNKIEDNLFQYRVNPKSHGEVKNRYWTNGLVPQKISLIEDVTTTAGSVLEFAKTLQGMGVEVGWVIVLLSRLEESEKSAQDSFEKLGIKFVYLATLEEMQKI